MGLVVRGEGAWFTGDHGVVHHARTRTRSLNQQGNVIPRKTSHYVVSLKHIPTHQNHGNSWPTEKTYRKEIPIKVLMKEKLSFNKQLIY